MKITDALAGLWYAHQGVLSGRTSENPGPQRLDVNSKPPSEKCNPCTKKSSVRVILFCGEVVQYKKTGTLVKKIVAACNFRLGYHEPPSVVYLSPPSNHQLTSVDRETAVR